MVDRDFTEVDLRAMLEDAKRFLFTREKLLEWEQRDREEAAGDAL